MLRKGFYSIQFTLTSLTVLIQYYPRVPDDVDKTPRQQVPAQSLWLRPRGMIQKLDRAEVVTLESIQYIFTLLLVSGYTLPTIPQPYNLTPPPLLLSLSMSPTSSSSYPQDQGRALLRCHRTLEAVVPVLQRPQRLYHHMVPGRGGAAGGEKKVNPCTALQGLTFWHVPASQSSDTHPPTLRVD